jgi:hypothetical protein
MSVRTLSVVAVAALALALAGAAAAKHFQPWGMPVNAESIPGASSELNTAFNDGCPIQSPDGLSLYIASNRPGGLGGQDIWVAQREHEGDAWGTPINVGAPVNSAADDFCPSPTRGHRFFFVSARAGGCGGPDVYMTRLRHGAFDEPVNLGCEINSAGAEASPSYLKGKDGTRVLYFSSARAGGFAPDAGVIDSDIYFSVDFGPAQLAPALNTASDDSRPNVRHDGREVVFDSTRPGTLGGPDLWTSSRDDEDAAWSPPTHLDAPVSSAASETRASLSWDGETMVFGSTRSPSEAGSNDVYVVTRAKGK